MRTVVYYAIHIEVEVVELRYAILRNELGDRWIPLTHPPEEFRDTHSDVTLVLREILGYSWKGWT